MTPIELIIAQAIAEFARALLLAQQGKEEEAKQAFRAATDAANKQAEAHGM